MLLNDEGKMELIKNNFHPYFDITIESNIVPENVNEFVNFVLPIDKISDYDFSEDSGLRKFFNEDFSNVAFTSNDNEVLFKYEIHKNVYFIRMPSFFNAIRMHILPKKYDASDRQSDTPLLLFKLDQERIDENNFECSSEYERNENKQNINLYYKESTQLDSEGMYKFNIRNKTRGLRKLQINIGYSYNDTNPTNPMMLEHFTGILDESDENGNPILIDDYDHIEIEFSKQSIYQEYSDPFDSTGDIYIDWGDNTNLERYTWIMAHTYSTSGNHTIKIYGDITGIYTPFYGIKGITSVIIPYGVTSLANSCFAWCTDLYSIYLPNSLTNIEKNCFMRTNLKSILIPYSVTNIGNNCFVANNNLESIILEWYSDSEIIPYNSSWLNNSSNTSFKYFIIPQNTTDLYVAKGYPSNLLIEDLKPRATRNKLTEFNISLMDVNCDNNINGDYTNVSQPQKLVNSRIEWPDEVIAYDDGKQGHPIGFINSHTIDTLYHKTIKYFNDDIYIEEDGKYINNNWDEQIIRGV